jgi:hypothetical protein
MRRNQSEKPDTPEILDQTHVAVRQMLHAEQITEDIYHKNLVSLAARWIVLGRIEDANAMVCELTPNYVAHTMPYQMQVDDAFRKVANFVSASLSAQPLDVDSDDVELVAMLLDKPVAKA